VSGYENETTAAKNIYLVAHNKKNGLPLNMA
jgi:hypothetical protein